MTMNWILLNVLFGVGMVAIAVGLPAWVMWKFPEGNERATAQLAPLRTRDHPAAAAHTPATNWSM